MRKGRKARRDGTLKALAQKKRGPKPKRTPEQVELERVKRENERLKHRLWQAEKIIEAQKKVSEILGVTLDPIDESE